MNQDTIDLTVGTIMLYALGHFYVIQFTKKYSERNWYEKALTIASAIFLFLIIAGLGIEGSGK